MSITPINNRFHTPNEIQGISEKQKEAAMKLVKVDGLKLESLSSEEKNDFEIVKIAIEENGLAIQFASDQLRQNLFLISIATQQNPEAINFAILNHLDLKKFLDRICERKLTDLWEN